MSSLHVGVLVQIKAGPIFTISPLSLSFFSFSCSFRMFCLLSVNIESYRIRHSIPCLATAGLILRAFPALQKQHLINPPGNRPPLY
jgi:hypothetical protein